jgi:ribosomal protein S14
MGGKGRGILSDFKMSRVSPCAGVDVVEQSDGGGEKKSLFTEANSVVSQFNFRVNALAGNLPGVKKASW